MSALALVFAAIFYQGFGPSGMPIRGAYPDGFGPVDRYASTSAACLGVVAEEVPADFTQAERRTVWAWCEYRAANGSHHGKYRSRVDGTQVHDRDRPAAIAFYGWALFAGDIDPGECIWHRAPETAHPRECRELAERWPFVNPLSERRRRRWMRSSHALEDFGTGGPWDTGSHLTYKHVPGCYPPSEGHRFDVGATVVVRRAVEICEEHGCSRSSLRRHW